MYRYPLVFSILFMLATLPGDAFGAEYYVTPDDPTYSTVGAVMAVVQAGDIVHVKPGSYPGFTVSVPVKIIGDGGRELTSIQGVVHIESSAAGTTLSDLTFDGAALGEPAVYANGDLTLSDCTFDGLEGWVSGLAAWDVSVVATNVLWTNNVNTAVYGENAIIDVSDSVFESNYTDGAAAAVHVLGGALTLRDTTFRGNEAVYGAGAIYVMDADADISSCVFEENEVFLEGGHGSAIRIGNWPDQGDATVTTTITDTQFVNNRGDRGSISFYQGGTLIIEDSTFELEDRGKL